MSASRDAILKNRFLQSGETEKGWLERVASQWANDDGEFTAFYRMMADKRALPNTPALANAGKQHPMGSACFVLPVPDDTEGIIDTLRAATLVHKYGGGTGFDFSPIRSRREVVASTGRAAPGPVEGPLKGYSEWLGRWSQAGLRSGANMGMLSAGHPDILDFIKAKRGTESVLTNFNISVKVSDAFMGSPDEELWDELVFGAWQNGEPGIYFEDTVNNARLHPETIHATNPCGEVPLLPYEACVLGSVNLAAHMVFRQGRWMLDEPSYRETIATLTVMLDNIIELQHYPLPEIEAGQKRYRKIGVGVMGYADALALAGVVYGSPTAIRAAEDWGRVLQEQSYATSRELMLQRGQYTGWKEEAEWNYPSRRNLNCQVIAPTGTISRLAECSFGIEPHFDTDLQGQYMSFVIGGAYTDFNPHYDKACFTPASMVDLKQHIETQAAWQQHIDQAVSKTVNCRNNTTQEQVSDAFIQAWESGCKGVTLLREGSRDSVVIGATEGDCNGAACAI